MAKRFKDSEQGQMMVEFGFMLFLLLAPLLATLLVVYEFLDKLVGGQEHLRYELRSEVDKSAPGFFRRIEKKAQPRADVPRALRWFMGVDRVEATVTLVSYGGCYQGLGLSEFRTFYQLRDVSGWR